MTSSPLGKLAGATCGVGVGLALPSRRPSDHPETASRPPTLRFVIQGMGALPNMLDMDVLKFYHAMELMDALRHLTS